MKTALLIQYIDDLTGNTELKMLKRSVLVAGRGYIDADPYLEVIVLSLCEGNRERMQEEGWQIDLKNCELVSGGELAVVQIDFSALRFGGLPQVGTEGLPMSSLIVWLLTAPGPYRARNDRLFRFDNELMPGMC